MSIDGAMGGGSKGNTAPTEYPNTLRQTQRLNILYMVGEGECEGFPTSDIERHVYIDGVPVKNSAGDRSYVLDIHTRNGSPIQAVIPGFTDISKVRDVSTQMLNGVPLERQITDTNTDAFTVAVRIPALQNVEADGAIKGSFVSWRVSVSADGGAFVTVGTEEAEEKSNGAFIRSTTYNLFGDAPWTIRVERLTADSVSTRLQNQTFWENLTEINRGTGNFDGAATFAIKNVDAREFSAPPEIVIDYLGRRVKIPHNYDGKERTYSGSFNGTLQTAYTDNPAWVLYDLLSDDIAAAGLPESGLDVYDFYEAGQWCDAQEPKLRISANITTQAEAAEVISAIASRMFAVMARNGNNIIPVVDTGSKPIKAIFSEANTLEAGESYATAGNFKHSTTKTQTRPAIALVSYQDPTQFHQETIERVVLQDAVDFHEQRGLRPPEINVAAMGCANVAEARQYGMYRLVTDFYQTKTTSFTCGAEGMRLSHGDHVIAYDNIMQQSGKQGSGRLAAGDRTFAQFDRPYTFEPGASYKVFLYDAAQNEAVTVDIVNPAIAVESVEFVSELSFDPSIGTMYAISSQTLEPQTLQVIGIKEDDSELLTYSVSGVNVLPNKWDVINDEATAIIPITNSQVNSLAPPATPINFIASASPTLSYRSNGYVAKIDLLWHVEDPDGIIEAFNLEYKEVTESPSAFSPLARCSGTSYRWESAKPGTYNFRIQSISVVGKRSPFSPITYVVENKPPKPSNVQNFRFNIQGGNEGRLILSWDIVPDVDVVNAGNYLIKYVPALTGSLNFNSGVFIPSASSRIPGNQTSIEVPRKQGTYQIIAQNSAGQVSETPAAVIVNLEALSQIAKTNAIVTIDESDAGFTGTKTNLQVASGQLKLAFTGAGSPNVETEGVYEFGQELNLGALLDVRLDVIRTSVILDEAELWDDAPGLFDDREGLWDGGDRIGAFSFLEVSISTDGSTFGDWQRLSSEQVVLSVWRLKLRLQFRSSVPTYNEAVDTLKVLVDVPDTRTAGSLTSGASALTKTFAAPFNTTPEVIAYGLDLAAGDRVEITSITTTNFQYAVKDASNAFLTGKTIKYSVIGF